MTASLHTEILSRVQERAEAGAKCKLGALLDSLELDDRNAVEYALAQVTEEADLPQHRRFFTIAWLEKLLNDHGYSIGKTVISTHLAGRCVCVKSR